MSTVGDAVGSADGEGDAHSEAEIRLLMEESRKKGYIDKTEYDFVDNVFDFSDVTPAIKMCCRFVKTCALTNVEEFRYLLR